MADSDNLFDAAIARADETIRGYMGTSATMTSGELSGAVIRGVFDDPENISYAGQGVRVEGSSPSLFVRTKGQRSSLKGGGSVLVVGNRRIPGAFIQQLKNGRWHVMQRVAGKNRYPIDVVKIPMAVPLTTAFKQNIERIRRERLPKELGYALQHQLRMVIKR
ncbi:hypothetical protein FJS90_003819 [Escherichia coli]|nr:hypothetical protein [Escherichia coli]